MAAFFTKMAASLKGIDPDLKHYLKINKLPEVYEVGHHLSLDS